MDQPIQKPKDAGEAFMQKQRSIKGMFDEKDINIRISWAINCAIEVWKGNKDVAGREYIKKTAIDILNMFDELKEERIGGMKPEVCAQCRGVAELVFNGLCKQCASEIQIKGYQFKHEFKDR